MVDVIGNTVEQLTRKFNEQLELVLEVKLHILALRAYNVEEYNLHALLIKALEKKASVGSIREGLERHGYEIELEHPPMDIKFKSGNLTAIMDLSQVRVRVRKTIMEV